MRIAISTENNAGLDSLVSPHFGHAPYFVLVDTEGDEIKSVSAVVNPFCGSHGCGDLAGFVASQAAQVMLVGGMGQRAVQAFQAQGIQAVAGASNSVRQTLERFLDGQLRGVTPCAESGHHGGCHDPD